MILLYIYIYIYIYIYRERERERDGEWWEDDDSWGAKNHQHKKVREVREYI
jgi:hypothetical protein